MSDATSGRAADWRTRPSVLFPWYVEPRRARGDEPTVEELVELVRAANVPDPPAETPEEARQAA
jgi:hypothetical protein